jgi:pilus assembly protein Flp/PilA
MKGLLARFVREEEGQDLVEYALLVGFIGLVAVTGVTALGNAINTYYGTTILAKAPFSS